MADSNSTDRIKASARTGEPKAIAQLLNQSFRTRNIKAFVQRRQTRLLIMLESLSMISQQAIAPKVVKGLETLGVQNIDSVDIALRLSGQTQAVWRVQTLLTTATATDGSAVPPSDPPNTWTIRELPEMPEPLVLPGWSFWFGWVVMSTLGSVLGNVAEPSYGVFGSFLALMLAGGGVAIGQWVVIRQEVTWASRWLEATLLGTLVSAILQLLKRWAMSIIGGSTPSLFLLYRVILPLLVIVPIFVFQWWVLRRRLGPVSPKYDNPFLNRYFHGPNLWLSAMLAIALVAQLMKMWLPSPTMGLLPSPRMLLGLAEHMAVGGTMLYLLRESRAERLKLNRYTDVTTRQRLIALRAKVNGWLFLEWIGWTVLGWVVSGVVLAILSPLVILNMFRISIMISIVTLFQWIALQRRIANSEAWFKKTILYAFLVPIVMGIVGLAVGAALYANLSKFTFYGAGSLPMLTAIGIGIIGFVVALLAVVVVQGKVLKRFGYRSAGWLLVHVMTIVTMLFWLPKHPFFTISAMAGCLILAPAAAMVWILGYPRSFQVFD